MITIVNYHLCHLVGWPNRIIVRRESHLHKLYSILSYTSTNADRQCANMNVPIGFHTKRVFSNTIEMISISIGVGSVRIHGTTARLTVWVLWGYQLIQNVLMACGGSIQLSYLYLEMDDIWLSDSPTRVCQVHDLLCEPLCTHGGSHGG